MISMEKRQRAMYAAWSLKFFSHVFRSCARYFKIVFEEKTNVQARTVLGIFGINRYNDAIYRIIKNFITVFLHKIWYAIRGFHTPPIVGIDKRNDSTIFFKTVFATRTLSLRFCENYLLEIRLRAKLWRRKIVDEQR